MTTLVSLAVSSVPLDARSLLQRIDARIRTLRRAISHDHGDEPYWQALATDAPSAQSERATLRAVANLLHVERATSRGRIHGTRFPTLEAQRERRWIQNDLAHEWPWLLEGRNMTIVGLGTIGLEVAKRASAFGMRLIA